MTEIRHLRPSDYRVMPWKNGGGTTTEIATGPVGASLGGAQPFDWRLSLASLDGPGPFSPFPGYDRVIMQLEGGPMALDHGIHGRQQLTLKVPYRFRGEWPTQGQLQGQAKDFNLMTRRGHVAAHVEVLRLAAGAALPRRPGVDQVVIYLLDGRLGGEHALKANETLILAATAPVALAASTEATAVLIELRRQRA